MMNKEISKIKAQWDIAYNLVTDLFKDKVDKGGHPYVGHLLRVYRDIENEKNKKCSDPDSTLSLFYEKASVAALLHDVLEDTEMTIANLESKGFDEEIIKAVDALTRRKEEDKYFDFIERVANNDIARIVKIYDLEDNMNIKRLDKFDEYDQKRLRKYFYCWKYLKGEINGIVCNNKIHPDRLLR